MSQNKFFALVMAGGKGTRFWPESTTQKPKQYLNLTGDKSLLEATLHRFEDLIPVDGRFIVTVKEQESLAKECSQGQIGNDGLIFEPTGRNTAPCILLALARLEKNGARPEDIVAICPSDHVILNKKGFKDTLLKAQEVAQEKGALVTIGIPPYFPHTGYGYIRKGSEETKFKAGHKVDAFVEKPNKEKAIEYLETGEYYWNAGMFIGSLGTFLQEFKSESPEIFVHYESLKESLDDPHKLAQVYNEIPAESVDYAVMEKSQNIYVVPAEFDWNDLGSWDALESVLEKEEGNTIVKTDKHFFENAEGNIVFAPNQFVSLINVKDLIVVSNDKTLMVLPKEDSQKVKKVVEFLKETPKGELLL